MASPEFGYAHARLQARHALRPSAAQWQRLQASLTWAHQLASAHAGPWAAWTEGLDEQADAHRIERTLRAHWQRHVQQVASWLPARWQAAARWFAALPELALRERPASELAADWLAGWRQRVPARDADAQAALQPALLLLPRLRESRARRGADDARVEPALLRLLRRHGPSPVSVFAHLALSALELERLRGGLVARRLLAPASSTAELS